MTMKRFLFLAVVFGFGAFLGSPLRSFADFTWSGQNNGITAPVPSSACQASGSSCVPSQACTNVDPAQSVWYSGGNVIVYSYKWVSDYTWGNCKDSTGMCTSWGSYSAPCAKVEIYG